MVRNLRWHCGERPADSTNDPKTTTIWNRFEDRFRILFLTKFVHILSFFIICCIRGAPHHNATSEIARNLRWHCGERPADATNNQKRQKNVQTLSKKGPGIDPKNCLQIGPVFGPKNCPQFPLVFTTIYGFSPRIATF